MFRRMSRSSVSVCAWPRAWRSLSARGWAGLAAGLILLSMPCARAEPGTASTDAPAYAPAYAPTYAPPAIAARYPDRLGLSLRISTLSLVAAQSGGEHVNTVSGFGGVLRYRFRPWLAGELSADLLGGDSGALHRTSVPFVASIIAELRPWGVVSPFVSAGLGVLWNRHQRSAAAGGDSFSDQQGLAQIGAGVRCSTRAPRAGDAFRHHRNTSWAAR